MLLAIKPSPDKTLRDLQSEWCDCRRCPLGPRAYKHVLYHAIPEHVTDTDVMMVGEGPGISEDAIGKPFIGPAGKLLKRTVTRAGGDDMRLVYTNLVACKPQDRVGAAFRAPYEDEIDACRPRLVSVIEIFKPNVIMLLGKIPQMYGYAALQMSRHTGCEVIEAPHPSAINHNGGDTAPNYPRYLQTFADTFDLARKMR